MAGTAAKSKRWYKGMLHCHCYWSDGRAFPEQGAKAYYDHGYHFYCMSDHNRLGKNSAYWRDVCEDEGPWPKNVFRPIFESYRKTFPDAEVREKDGKTQVRIKTFDEVKAKFDQPGRFLVLPGMELTRMADGRHVHMNYVNLNKGLPNAEAGGLIQGYGKTVSEVIGKSKSEVDSMAAELGNPPHLFMVNHPHWRFYDVVPQDVIDHPEVRFFEICNCGADRPRPRFMAEDDFSCDRFWDVVLAHRCRNGQPMLYGVGSDDAHWYPNSGTPESLFPFADGYIQVRAEELTPEALISAMDRGDFYASCGVDLEDVRVDAKTGTQTVSVAAKPGVAYTIRFVGTKCDFIEDVEGEIVFKGDRRLGLGARTFPVYSETIGVTLRDVKGKPGERVEASYTLKDDDLYVRAIIESSELATPYGMKSFGHPKHARAWTQPIRRGSTWTPLARWKFSAKGVEELSGTGASLENRGVTFSEEGAVFDGRGYFRTAMAFDLASAVGFEVTCRFRSADPAATGYLVTTEDYAKKGAFVVYQHVRKFFGQLRIADGKEPSTWQQEIGAFPQDRAFHTLRYVVRFRANGASQACLYLDGRVVPSSHLQTSAIFAGWSRKFLIGALESSSGAVQNGFRGVISEVSFAALH